MAKRLTAARVKTAPPGVHGDQFGLRLRVLATGARTWVWRGTVNGRRVDLGLGGYPVVTLAEARELALDCKRAAWRGDDPRAVRNRRTAPDVHGGGGGGDRATCADLEEPADGGTVAGVPRGSCVAGARAADGRQHHRGGRAAGAVPDMDRQAGDRGAATDPHRRGDEMGRGRGAPDRQSGRGRCHGGAPAAERDAAASSSGGAC